VILTILNIKIKATIPTKDPLCIVKSNCIYYRQRMPFMFRINFNFVSVKMVIKIKIKIKICEYLIDEWCITVAFLIFLFLVSCLRIFKVHLISC
jgi:hypothetical protein